jgi:cytoplasmic iron level regulating protein YaaA (DUF328/UPF0246 family)
MSTLLIQSCSNSKKSVSEPVPAFDLYSGYYYRIIKKARREGEYDDNIDIRILSAEHGLLHPEEKIETYDREMDASRADELKPVVVPELCRVIGEGEYEDVVLNMGKTYRRALKGLDSKTDAEVVEIEGGLGERGHVLKKFVRGEEVIET